MDELKSLEKKNKFLKKQIKKVEAEIEKRIEVNPSYADSDIDFNRDDDDQSSIFDDLIERLTLRKDDHFKMCANSLDLFTKTIDNLRQSSNTNSMKTKRIKLGNGLFKKKSLSTSNSLNISNNLNSFRNDLTFASNISNVFSNVTSFKGDATFISSKSKATKNDRPLMDQTFVASKVNHQMNETFVSTKSNKRLNENKENDKTSSIDPYETSDAAADTNDAQMELYNDETFKDVDLSTDQTKVKKPSKAAKTTDKQKAKSNLTKTKSKSTVKRTRSKGTESNDNLIIDNLPDPNILNGNFLIPTPSKYNLRKSVRLVKKNYCC